LNKVIKQQVMTAPVESKVLVETLTMSPPPKYYKPN